MKSMRTCSLLNCTGRLRTGVALLGLALTMAAGAAGDRLAAGNPRPAQTSTATQERPTMWMTVGDAKRYAVTLEDNPTARAFVQLLPLTLDMPDLNGVNAGQEPPLCDGEDADLSFHAGALRRIASRATDR